ncbi:MAG: DUF4011 domain-containing protein [Methanobrevibacter sp.]|jgi:superfamily I DNA and/or RNA helicase/very-short-patch-repair endonuclease|nr:DUF4011 domain-containing protein [Candidatus Methanovirga meridionalis]
MENKEIQSIITEQINNSRKNLLDMGMRNNLLNFKDLKRNIPIIDENPAELYQILVFEEKTMEFLPNFDKNNDNEKKLISPSQVKLTDFYKKEDEDNKNYSNVENQVDELEEHENDILWSMSLNESDIPDKHKDLLLQTNLSEKELQKRLFGVSQNHKTILEEQGYNNLFLALGFLEWSEIDYVEGTHKAPLILIPVNMQRESVGSPFTIKWDNKDVQNNISLQYKLREQGINLPNFEEFDSKDNIYHYFGKVEKAISSNENWKINQEIYLSSFDFKKFVMYRDLDLENWSNIEDNPICELFNPSEDNDPYYFDENNIDKLIKSSDVFHVVDADSSQITVLEEAKKGKNLVVEGPPGTGKSQTIVNLIAELMANEKTILFVSEKMAALEVVKKRLDDIGLGSGCLELHSNKSNKKEFLNEIEHTLNLDQNILKDTTDFHDLDSLKEKLNNYMEIISTKYKNTDLSPYELIGIYEFNRQKIENLNQKLIRFEMKNLDNCSSQKRGELINEIEKISNVYDSVKPIKENPWRNTSPENLLPDDIEDISENLNNLSNYLKELLENIENLSNVTGSRKIENLEEIEKCLKNYNVLEVDPKLINGNELENLLNNLEEYKRLTKDIKPEVLLKDLEKKGEHVKSLNKNIDSLGIDLHILENENLKEIVNDIKKYKSNIDNSDVNSILKDKNIYKKLNLFREKRKSFFSKIFNSEFKAVHKEFKNYYSNLNVPDEKIENDFDQVIKWNNHLNSLKEKILNYYEQEANEGKIIIESEKLLNWANEIEEIKKEISEFTLNKKYITFKDLEKGLNELIKIQKLCENIDSNGEVGNYFFSDSWEGCQSNINELKSKYNEILIFNELFNSNFFTLKTVDLLKEDIDFNEMKKYLKNIENLKIKIIEKYTFLDKLLHFENEDLCNDFIKSREISKIQNHFNDLYKHVRMLYDWRLYKNSCEKCAHEYTKDLIEIITNDEINKEAIIPTFNYNLANNILKNILKENNSLHDFSTTIHEENINKFKKLDLKVIKLNKFRVNEVLWRKKPSISGTVNPSSELGRLLREMNKKRKIKPIRQILSECLNVIRDIKPCFMMSPISIAQFLNSDHYKSYFDYVIFDEASQVKTEDALGALLRGKNYIIMGDTKQLPPTAFFDSGTIDDEENDDDYSFNDLESILHLTSSVFDSRMLKWHYRSKHESLIAVSNAEFYNNSLFIYPSPFKSSEDLGLKFEFCKDCFYNRGKGSRNPLEAKKVVDYAINHFRKHGNTKSLGIGTFSASQQQAILEELELRLKENPEIEKFFNQSGKDGFFVKNLENIQGDERDIILISVGYGFDKDRKLTLNFGPLNRDGGERRLNVIITRAREKCVVFSNFKSSDLNPEKSTSVGLRALKTFLYYAEKGEFPKNYYTGEDFDSDFEKSVYNFLVDKGYIVEKQVGSAGFRIDLAVVDKQNQGNYIIGIECDGAPYHSSPIARDRDRLRQEILEGLGWNFHRIWSTEWYNNRENAKKSLIEAIELSNKYENNLKTDNEKFRNLKDDINHINENLSDSDISNLLEKKEEKSNTVDETIPHYQHYNTYKRNNFYNSSKTEKKELIFDIIDFESPIHINEIYNRMKDIYETKATKKFKNTVDLLISDMSDQNRFHVNNEFYYSYKKPITLRKREKPNIGLISDEEIKEAIILVLKKQYALQFNDLAKEFSMLLGFNTCQSNTKNRFLEVINNMIILNEVSINSNGDIELFK